MASMAPASLYLQSSGNRLHSASSSSLTKLAYPRPTNFAFPNGRSRRANAFRGFRVALPRTAIDLYRNWSYSALRALQSSSMANLGDQKGVAEDIKVSLDGKEQENIPNTEDSEDVELEKGYKMSTVCDRMIDVFMTEKPNSSDWRKLLAFTEEWEKIKPHFFNRCRMRADDSNDPEIKQNLLRLIRKVKEVDDDMQRHNELFKQVQENPLEIDTIVARRRKDFTRDFFEHLKIISDSHQNNLEAKDELARIASKCLTALQAHDKALADHVALGKAQLKFDDVLNSPSLEVARNKINNLAKKNQLDSTFMLTVSKAWAAAKESTLMKDECKDILFQLYVEARRSLQEQVPKEVRIIKYLLTIEDPELQLAALAQAFTPGDEIQGKDADVLYTKPEYLHRMIQVVLDAYYSSRQGTLIKEARKLMNPMVIQRLEVLKGVVEQNFM
ncbi:hypothetical protein SUGI_1060710 [Cryptomeria japonica]|uniref:uncharacterized protein At4g37920 n=1 Tax=Cryptomeria japonica TaxID=3369 RepID=UPI0024146F95|nr:uncharacterized protein At4g37920 [Cryptomeria japonica]GLJ49897.1 hypothetical protein SUGI_1060710 [Cryptomeria japonica]